MKVGFKIALLDLLGLVFGVLALSLFDMCHKSACSGENSIAAMTNKLLITPMHLDNVS